MSIVTTSTARTARLFWSDDPAVTVTDEVLAQLQPKQAEPVDATTAVASGDALPAPKPPEPRPRMFVPAGMCTVTADATSFDVRALSYLQAQEHGEQPIDVQIARANKACLVAIDGDADKAAQFLAAPPAELWLALYRAVGRLTWGNLPG